MNNPYVDVAIIAYNQENLIQETLDSAINQSYKNIGQIIVADDGSTDNTAKIIKDYASCNPKIKPVLSENNEGIPYNVNRALNYVKSDYVCIVGGDDLLHTDKIEKQLNYLSSNPHLVGCAHDMEVFNSEEGRNLGKFSEVISYKKVRGEISIEQLFEPSLFLCPSSILYKTDKIPKHFFDTRLKYLNDFLFNVDVLMEGNIGFIDDILGTYRIHGGNITTNTEAQKLAFEDALIALAIIISRYPELSSSVNRRKQALYMDQILKNIKEGNNSRAKLLSKNLISEGFYLKGISGFLLANTLNKDRIERIYQNRKVLGFFLKFF